jgi:hypothetical protein
LEALAYNLWRGQNDNVCKLSNSPCKLLLCSFCPTALHLEWVKLAHVLAGDYRCSACQAALGPAARASSSEQPSMDNNTTGTRCARTDPSDPTQYRKSFTCSRADRHIGRCNRRLSADPATSDVHTATTDSGQCPPTEVAPVQPHVPNALTDTVPLPSTQFSPRHNITRHHRRLGRLQQPHTERQDIDADDQRLYHVAMTHEEIRVWTLQIASGSEDRTSSATAWTADPPG